MGETELELAEAQPVRGLRQRLHESGPERDTGYLEGPSCDSMRSQEGPETRLLDFSLETLADPALPMCRVAGLGAYLFCHLQAHPYKMYRRANQLERRFGSYIRTISRKRLIV